MVRLTIFIMILLAAGCRPKETELIWDHEATSRIKSANIIILSEHDEIKAKRNIDWFGQASRMFGTSGAIVASLVGELPDSFFDESVRDTLVALSKENLKGMSMSQRLKETLEKNRDKLAWLNITTIEISDMDVDKDSLQELLVAYNEDVLILLKPSYYFSADLTSLVVKISKEMYPRSQYLLAITNSQLGEKDSRLTSGADFSFYELPMASIDMETNAILWLQNGADKIKEAVEQGTDKLTRSLIDGLSKPFPVALEKPK